jgi:hypothetical protein
MPFDWLLHLALGDALLDKLAALCDINLEFIMWAKEDH